MKEHYLKCLSSGMFWEWFPQLTGEWDKDKTEFRKIYNKIKKYQNG